MRHGLKTIPKEPPQKSERRSPDRPEHLLFRGNPSPVSLPSPQSPTSVASSSFLNCALTINLGATRAEGPRDESPGQGSRSGRRPGLNASSLPRPVARGDTTFVHGRTVSSRFMERSLADTFREKRNRFAFVPNIPESFIRAIICPMCAQNPNIYEHFLPPLSAFSAFSAGRKNVIFTPFFQFF